MNNGKEEVVGQLLKLLPHAEIAHHIPGRIRLKVLPSAFSTAVNMDVDGLARRVPGILSVRANIFAKSVTIEYDSRHIAPGLWEEIQSLRRCPSLTPKVEADILALWD